MRCLLRVMLVVWVGLVALEAPAPDFHMADGSVISGELVAPNDDGSVIRRASGGLTSRLPWDEFSQETLKEMVRDPQLKELVEAYIDAPEYDPSTARPEIIIQEPEGRVERPEKRPGLFGALGTTIGMFFVGLFLLGNAYAGYEVSVYRNYPPAAVVATSVVFPLIGPILFLCMPTRVNEDVENQGQFEAPQEVETTGAQDLAAAGLAGSGLSLSAGQKAAASTQTQAAVYRASDTEFNRSFFEKSFPLFFRMTRSDADKGTLLAIRSAKGEVVATRISRISANEIGLVTQKGHEVQLRFADITEVQVRPR